MAPSIATPEEATALPRRFDGIPMRDDLEERARRFAEQAHRGQMYGDGPFVERHLARVVATLRRYGETDPTLLAAARLHDTLEDTDTTVEDLREAFGDDVANIVDRLTDQPGRNRRERQARTHARIREDPRAVRVKLADRIANVEAALEQKSNLRGMYRKEYPRFRQDLHRPGEFDAMWRDLDRLVKRRRRA